MANSHHQDIAPIVTTARKRRVRDGGSSCRAVADSDVVVVARDDGGTATKVRLVGATLENHAARSVPLLLGEPASSPGYRTNSNNGT